MNIIAIDIGNTNITIGFFLDDTEKFIESVPGNSSDAEVKVKELIIRAWDQIPLAESAAAPTKDGVIVVSSVKPVWADMVSEICSDELDEKIKLIGTDIPLPIEMGVENPAQVGTDRVVAAAAAFAVVEDAVAVADFGSAVTVDLVDEHGVFLGGVISPGFDLAARALKEGTAKLPEVKVTKPKNPIGATTEEAINCGLYYSAIGMLETVTRNFADQIGKWPQLIVTGGAAKIIKDDCEFVDSWVTDLAVKGVVLAYKKYIFDKNDFSERYNDN